MRVTCVITDESRPGSGFRQEHGQCFVVETEHGRVLFDAGGSGHNVLANLDLLGTKPRTLSAIALSHAHDDHTGGLRAVLQRTGRVPLFAHPDIFRPRFSKSRGRAKSRGLPIQRAELQQLADLFLSADPQELLPGVWTTGEILARPEPEGRSAHHFVASDGGLEQDPYRDDLSLVLQEEGQLLLLCGCCHAGLLNTLHQVRARFVGEITAVVGGFHLVGLDKGDIRDTVRALQAYGPPTLYPNHCTGRAAMAELEQAYPDRVKPCLAGDHVVFVA